MPLINALTFLLAIVRPPDHGWAVEALMKAHGIPGMSVAVIDDFKIVWTKGYGVTRKGGTTPVTPYTLFLAGSISKPVAAVAALSLVERGSLTLDRDVNAQLRSWHVPENEFDRTQKVTLERILDHTAGFTGGDFFPGYARGASVPSLLQILDGLSPANNPPIRVGYVPGTRWQYSGAGYLVAQQLMIDATNQPFPQIARDAVFEPLGMDRSTFEQPLPEDLAKAAASGTLMNGDAVDGGWHVQPEMAAGGLWTSPSDLAKLAIEIAEAARGRSNRVLSQRMALAMISPHWSSGVINILGTRESPDSMGYGFFVGDRHRFGHIGGNIGYQATMVMFGDTGKGAVIMTNDDIGLQAGNEVLNRIAQLYHWNYAAPPPP
jgi:CubicO group peptidase (beta-lactamase class C family)